MHAEPLGLRGAQVGNLWFRVLHEKPLVTQLVKKLPTFTELKIELPGSQNSVIGPYSESIRPSSKSHIMFPKDQL